jgi:hypothetical protein
MKIWGRITSINVRKVVLTAQWLREGGESKLRRGARLTQTSDVKTRKDTSSEGP